MNTSFSFSSFCSNLLKLATSAFLIALTALTVNIVQSTLTPEFTINVNYQYPLYDYDGGVTTKLETPEPTSPVDYSNSSDVPPGYVVPQRQPAVEVSKK